MNISIHKNCTGCGLCESINSDVFKVNGIAHVNNDMIKGNEQDCINAAEQCPVSAIKINE